VAVLGALINPLAALLPLIETGPGENADCQSLVAAAERTADAAKRAPSGKAADSPKKQPADGKS